MSTIEFESSRFAPFLPESCQVNPGVYGFELALWLTQSLAARGIITSYPISEDWGWFLEHTNSDAELMIGCSSTDSAGDASVGASIAWMIAVDMRKRLRKPNRDRTAAAIDRVAREIVALLEAEGIAASLHDD